MSIEPDLAARASGRLTPADFERLEALQRAHDDARDPDERHEAHLALHAAMLGPAATAWDTRVLDMLWHASERYVRTAFDRLAGEPTEPERRHRAHADLMAALRTGDAEAASRAVVEHLSQTERIVLDSLETRPAAPGTATSRAVGSGDT